MRFGLIGLGAIGQVRRAALGRTPGCSLTAVFDQNPARLCAKEADIADFPTAEAMLASDSCDGVIISTPPDSHEALAIAAMESGKHVLVEKPMASSAAACRRMVDTSRRTGRVLAIGFNHRYFAATKAVRQAIASGAIGTLSHVRAYAGHVGLAEFKAPWMYARDVMGGGTLMDNGIHVLDLTCHLMGGVDHVRGATSSNIWKLDVEDNAFAVLINSKGVVGFLHSSWSEWKGYHFYVEAYGDRGMARAYYAPMSSTLITMDRPGGPPRVQRNFYPAAILREKLFGWQSTIIRTFVEEFQDFVALAEERKEGTIIARGEDGWRIAEIVEAVYTGSLGEAAAPSIKASRKRGRRAER
jgi:predicted dehydrogenase